MHEGKRSETTCVSCGSVIRGISACRNARSKPSIVMSGMRDWQSAPPRYTRRYKDYCDLSRMKGSGMTYHVVVRASDRSGKGSGRYIGKFPDDKKLIIASSKF